MRRGLRDLLPRGHRNRISTKEKNPTNAQFPIRRRGQTTKLKDEFRCLSPDCSGPLLGIELWSDSYFFSDSGTAPGVPGTEPPRLRKSRVPSARTKFLATALLVPSFA